LIVLLGILVQTAPSCSSTAPYKEACCQAVSALAVLLPFILLSVFCLVVFQLVTHHATMPPPYSHSCCQTRTRRLCPDLRFACKTEHGSCGSNSVLKCKIERGSSVVRVRSEGSNSRFDSSGGVAECDWARLILSAECGPSCYGKRAIGFGFAIAVKARTCCALLDGCFHVCRRWK